jgi:hypothetical protein
MMTTTTTTTDTTARQMLPTDGVPRPSMAESVFVALGFSAAMGLALVFAGVVTATMAGSMPAGPGGLALMLGMTFGTVGATLAVTRRAFLGVLDAV